MALRIDLQTHTNHSSSCGWMTPEKLVRRADRVGLDGVAITDHNTMSAIRPARAAASDELVVIPAEEIDTTEGQLIGLFLSEPINAWQSPAAVIEQIHEQGGLVLAPHPFDALRAGLTTIASHVEKLDLIEVLNSRCIRRQYNERAQTFATKYGLPATGGSDAHFASEVGTAYTEVQIETEPDNKAETLTAVEETLQAGKVTPTGKSGSFLVHAGTKGVKLYNRVRRR